MIGLPSGNGNTEQRLQAQQEHIRHQQLVEAIESNKNNSGGSGMSIPTPDVTKSPLAYLIGGVLLLWFLLPWVAAGGSGYVANRVTAGKGLRTRLLATLLAALAGFGGGTLGQRAVHNWADSVNDAPQVEQVQQQEVR